jgi:hypothetical protein
LTNGDFETPSTGAPFDWSMRPIDGAQSRIAEYGSGGDGALQVQFYGMRVPFRNVAQTLLLSAGRYRLSGEVIADLDTPRGMQWTIACPDRREILGETALVSGRTPWTKFDLIFDVPEGGNCRAQFLRLELAARIPSEQEAKGDIWYDDMRITRLPPGDAPSAEPGIGEVSAGAGQGARD